LQLDIVATLSGVAIQATAMIVATLSAVAIIVLQQDQKLIAKHLLPQRYLQRLATKLN